MRIRQLFHPATVVAVIALSISLGSSAMAAALITGAQIKDGTVTTADVKNGTLRTGDLTAAAIDQLKGATGPAGPAGPQGVAGVSGWELTRDATPAPANTFTELHRTCPGGKLVLSANGFFASPNDAVQVVIDGVGSGATAYTDGLATNQTLGLQMICAFAS